MLEKNVDHGTDHICIGSSRIPCGVSHFGVLFDDEWKWRVADGIQRCCDTLFQYFSRTHRRLYFTVASGKSVSADDVSDSICAHGDPVVTVFFLTVHDLIGYIIV